MRLSLLRPALSPPPLYRPIYGGRVAAGFPSPAEDYVEARLDLNELLVAHKDATYFFRVRGDSMVGARVFDGDLLVVDRSKRPAHGLIVVAVINQELTVKRLYRRGGVIKLCTANPEYPDITLTGDVELAIWGVVTGVVRKL